MTPGTPTAIPPPRGFSFDNNLGPNFSPRLSPAIDGTEQNVTLETTTSTTGSRPFAGGSHKSKLGNRSEGPSYGDLEIGQFEFNTPEHLPSSPLCPKNPKHKSGGTGICVYHGRGSKRTKSNM